MSVAASLSLTSHAVADDTAKPNDVTKSTVGGAADRPLLPAGITMKDLNADRGIEKAFKDVTEDAMSKTGFDNLVGRLVDQDRDRIKKSVSSGTLNNINGSKNQKLDDIIATLQGEWKTKYNHTFDIDYTKVFTKDFVIIQTGEVADAGLLVGKWPVDVMVPRDIRDMKPGTDSDLNRPGSGTGVNSGTGGLASGTPRPTDASGKLTQSDADQAKNKSFGGDVNLEKGRNVAVAQFKTSSYFGGLNASMIHEAGGWKFDIPNNIDAQKLYDNLVSNLTMVERGHTQWPDDINEAYRRVGAAVVAALYDAPYPGDILRPTAPGAAMAR